MSSIPLFLNGLAADGHGFSRIAVLSVLFTSGLFDAFQIVVYFSRARKGRHYSPAPLGIGLSFIAVLLAGEPVFIRAPWWLFKPLDLIAFFVSYAIFLLTVAAIVKLLFWLLPARRN